MGWNLIRPQIAILAFCLIVDRTGILPVAALPLATLTIPTGRNPDPQHQAGDQYDQHEYKQDCVQIEIRARFDRHVETPFQGCAIGSAVDSQLRR
jgi:hypothetical protein